MDSAMPLMNRKGQGMLFFWAFGGANFEKFSAWCQQLFDVGCDVGYNVGYDGLMYVPICPKKLLNFSDHLP